MIQHKWINEILEKTPGSKDSHLNFILWCLALTGAIAFIVALLLGESVRAWGIFLVNYLFWSGIALAGVTFAAILQVTKAKWSRPVKRIGEAMGAFLPVSLILFFILFLGADDLFSWIKHPIPEKKAWLNLPFLFSRDLVAVLGLYGLCFIYIYFSLRPDLGLVKARQDAALSLFASGLVKNWRGQKEEEERCNRINNVIAPLLILTYALALSLLAFDLVMSLSPYWFSSLFGGYFFISNLYLGIASMILVTLFIKVRLGFDKFLTVFQFYDLGKLLFVFCLLWAYFFWSQYLPIWYGNLPEETHFLIIRFHQSPWKYLSVVILFTNFLCPFLILLSKNIKKRPKHLALVAAMVFFGMLAERYLLILPSIWQEPELPFGMIEVLVTLGFFSLFAVSYLEFMRHFPIMPISDHKFQSIESDLLYFRELYPEYYKA